MAPYYQPSANLVPRDTENLVQAIHDLDLPLSHKNSVLGICLFFAIVGGLGFATVLALKCTARRREAKQTHHTRPTVVRPPNMSNCVQAELSSSSDDVELGTMSYTPDVNTSTSSDTDGATGIPKTQ